MISVCLLYWKEKQNKQILLETLSSHNQTLNVFMRDLHMYSHLSAYANLPLKGSRLCQSSGGRS